MTTLYKDHEEASERFGETNDCTVKAAAMALNIPYVKAHALCEKYGRTSGHGMRRVQLCDLLKDKGLKLGKLSPFAMIGRYPRPHNNLQHVTTHHTHRFPKVWQDGYRYLIFTNSHVAFIDNGKLHDWSGGRSFRVNEIWRIEE